MLENQLCVRDHHRTGGAPRPALRSGERGGCNRPDKRQPQRRGRHRVGTAKHPWFGIIQPSSTQRIRRPCRAYTYGDRDPHDRGRPITRLRVANAFSRVAQQAGIGHVTPHQLRHTLATQAINNGMSLDAIAAMLGHKTPAVTMVYARIADTTVADEYFAVTQKVEALYDTQLPAQAEGTQMRHLRQQMRRMLGNGYCERPTQIDCNFECICESCSFFTTGLEFRPTLQLQHDDAVQRGQSARSAICQGLLERVDRDTA